jgi:hypothetical protein
VTEYGLFNDEGCVERGFWSEREASAAIGDRYHPDDELMVESLCSDHADDEQPANGCELCAADDDDTDS